MQVSFKRRTSVFQTDNGMAEFLTCLFYLWGNKMIKKLFSKNNKPKMGYCDICNDDEEEVLVNLLGIDVCEGCYFDLINQEHGKLHGVRDLYF